MNYSKLLLIILLAGTSACQSAERERAVLASLGSKAQDIQLLQAVIGSLLNNPQVLIADDAFSKSSNLIIERARNPEPNLNTGREFERPMHFQLWKEGKNCLLEYVESGEVEVIPNINCKAIKSQQ